MLVFAATGGQLDHRSGLLEDLAAPVEDEVVVGGDLSEGDGVRRLDSVQGNLMPLPPRATFF